MPFTPIHLGPGAFFKAIGGDRFSFMVFGGSQVLMDIEPAYRMIVRDHIIHGPSHTLAGVAVIGLVATASGAFAGTLSHILFDTVMHSDMMPWSPPTQSNDLLGIVSIDTLYIACVLLGVVGAMLLYVRNGDR